MAQHKPLEIEDAHKNLEFRNGSMRITGEEIHSMIDGLKVLTVVDAEGKDVVWIPCFDEHEKGDEYMKKMQALAVLISYAPKIMSLVDESLNMFIDLISGNVNERLN